MKRRKFVAASALIGAAALPSNSSPSTLQSTNEYYELRQYEISFAGDRKSLISYLHDVLNPTLRRAGVNNIALLKERGDAEPNKVWMIISYPGLETYQTALSTQLTDSFIETSKDYAGAGKTYNRYSSFLLKAFDGLPQMIAPGDQKNLFELRIYEGVNEDAVRRKVSMFDNEEIALFNKVGLDPVLFGKMVIGPYMPCLVYILAFENMEARSTAWGKFVAHPDWNRMKVLPKYANTVSNIRKIFLEKM